MRFLAMMLLALGLASCAGPEQGLLFSLSGDHGFNADYARGNPEPNFLRNVQIIQDGAPHGGPAFRCAGTQVMSYWAPGNIYAEHGTLSFFWRSREPVGPTAFPIFRVSYADHTSWDMVWLRIDYNGHGFDAFVTDANLARTRVSVTLNPFPAPDQWTHLALAWDETSGIRFYVNGKLAAENRTSAVYSAALDQFGPHSRIISPHQVQSDYNYIRGGDLDELRIYDRPLESGDIASLARGVTAQMTPPEAVRSLDNGRWRDEWYLRYGWNRAGDVPLYFSGPAIAIRKVEIHDAYDLKRWYWKANDGIRETTWPGVYNRSRLPGRNDYFQLPDWDCYVDSGKAVTFTMPDEPWNHLEISGAAWGRMELLSAAAGSNPAAGNDGPGESTLLQRPQGQEKTFHQLATAITGRKIRFTNVQQEEPIGELSAYYVAAGREPASRVRKEYALGVASPGEKDAGVGTLVSFINGRFPPDERAMMVGLPVDAVRANAPATRAGSNETAVEKPRATLPVVHVLIADDWDKLQDGLDGIAIDLPPLSIKPTHGGLIPLNIQVKDPLWALRDMLDFTFSMKPGEGKTLWLDLRDRLLPPGMPLYLTVASASGEFSPASLQGAKVRLIFKPRELARPEHELDRFTQVKDLYAHLTEEHPASPKLDLYNRLLADTRDLVRVNPDHNPGRYYAAILLGTPVPKVVLGDPPAGVPLWAYRQVQLLEHVKYFVNWYVDNRQVAFGDFGGGISDDTDLTNTWPGVAFMGAEPEKLKESIHRLLEADYNNGMFTRGLPTIQADELHSYEEGINCLGQNLILDYGNPRQLERAMETQRGVESITGINAAGHRHIMTSYYNGKKMAEEGPWGWAKPYSYLVLQPGQLLVDYNGNPRAKKVIVELADGLLAHRQKDEQGHYFIPAAIQFKTDAEGPAVRTSLPWSLFWSTWKWTGERKYLDPLFDSGGGTGRADLLSVNANVVDLLGLRGEWSSHVAEFAPMPVAPMPPWKERRGGGGATTTQPATQSTRPPATRAGGSEAAAATGAGDEEPTGSRTLAPARPGPGAGKSGHVAWQLSGDKHYLETLYSGQLTQTINMEYINTEGSLWIDRVGVQYADLQRARLGGIALVRGGLSPGNAVSWQFHAPATEQSLAILIPNATATSFKVIAFNLDNAPVTATMTGWNIDPGMWDMTQGLDTNNDDVADQPLTSASVKLERGGDLVLTFPPRATTVLTFQLKTPGTPYWSRPDLGISRDDIEVQGRTMKVKVHSLGSVDAPAATITLVDASGRVMASATVPPLPAPFDLFPRTADVALTLPADTSLTGCAVIIEPDHNVEEITRRNNRVQL